MIAMNVPINEYDSTDPMFLANGFFYMLYPDSKIIGGSRRIMNRLLKWFEIIAIVFPIDSSFKRKPHSIPIMVVRPASYKYLCLDFFKKCPHDMAIISRKIMQSISVESID